MHFSEVLYNSFPSTAEHSGIELNRTVMAKRCEKIVSTVLSDWKYFKTIENPNILVVKVRNAHLIVCHFEYIKTLRLLAPEILFMIIFFFKF